MLIEHKDITIKQLINFIQSIRKINDWDTANMTLSELITRCFNDKRMFDSWFNHLDVMN